MCALLALGACTRAGTPEPPVAPVQSAPEPEPPKHVEADGADLPVLPPGEDTSCGTYSDGAAGSFDLMKGRLTIPGPQGAKDIAKAYDLMGAPEPRDHESRLLHEASDGAKYVVFAREIWQTGPLNGEAAMDYFTGYFEAERAAFEFGRVTAGEGLKVFVAVPKQLSAVGDAVLTLGALVRHPDDTLQAIDFYISPVVLPKSSGCSNYALSLLNGLQAGKRSLDARGGKKRISTLGHRLEVDVPSGFVVTTKPGPDFDVHYVRKLAPLGEYPGYLLIYVGGHPDMRPLEGPGKTVDDRGTLNGKSVKWVGFRGKQGGVVRATTALGGRRDLQLQAMRIATRASAFLDELLPIAESIRVRSP